MKQIEPISTRLHLAVITILFVNLIGCSSMEANSKDAAQRFSDSAVQQLVRAAEAGDVKTIRYLVEEKGVDVNATGEGGTTPLAWAMAAQSVRGTQTLLQLGANPNQAYEKGYTPMWFAAGGNNIELLELLLKHGGNPNLSKDAENLLIQAVQNKQIENYKLLLQYGADINSAADLNRTVAIYTATMGLYDVLYQNLKDGYTHDLVKVAQLVEKNIARNIPEQQVWRVKVISKLKELGVKYPLPPAPKPQPIRLSSKTRERLEKLDREGKLPPTSRGAEMLEQDRSLD